MRTEIINNNRQTKVRLRHGLTKTLDYFIVIELVNKSKSFKTCIRNVNESNITYFKQIRFRKTFRKQTHVTNTQQHTPSNRVIRISEYYLQFYKFNLLIKLNKKKLISAIQNKANTILLLNFID